MKKVALALLLLTGAAVQAYPVSEFIDAVRAGRTAQAEEMLLKMPTLVDASAGQGLSAFHLAAGRGDVAMLKVLGRFRVRTNIIDYRMGVSVLHKAVYSGNAEAVGFVLEHGGAIIDLASPSNGNTALHDALYFRAKSPAVIERLLRAGASLAIRNRAGLTPAQSAEALGDREAQALIRAEEARRFTPAGKAVWAAVRANDVAQVRRFIRLHHDALSERDEQGFTPLIWAARSGFAEITEALLAAGVDPNQNDEWMQANAGHKAGYWGRAAIIPILARYRWNVNAQGGYNGYTALHDAVARDHVETVRELVKAHAYWNIEGHDGKTPIDLAKAHGNPEILRLIPLD